MDQGYLEHAQVGYTIAVRGSWEMQWGWVWDSCSVLRWGVQYQSVAAGLCSGIGPGKTVTCSSRVHNCSQGQMECAQRMGWGQLNQACVGRVQLERAL